MIYTSLELNKAVKQLHQSMSIQLTSSRLTSAAPVSLAPIHTMRTGQVPCLACKGTEPHLTYPASHASRRCRCRSAGQQRGSASLPAPEAAWAVVPIPASRYVLPVSWPHRFLTDRQHQPTSRAVKKKWQSDVRLGRWHTETHAARRCRLPKRIGL